jgi:cell division protein FtsB
MSYNRQLELVVKAKDQVLSARDESGRTDPVAGRRAWVLGTVIALVALTVGSVFGDRGILNLMHKRQEVDELRVELETLRAENARLASEVVALRSSPRAVERLAREQLGLARPDETVFLIREGEPAPPR